MSDMIDHLINDIDSMRDLTADELESVSGGAMMVVENPPPQPKSPNCPSGALCNGPGSPAAPQPW